MARVIHVRLHGLADSQRDTLHARFQELAASREWRDQVPWLADRRSTGLFEQLYHDSVRAEEGDAVSAATFLRVAGDETDALALVFILRDLS
ncbi:MAG TPA: hypothetical protein VFA70_01925, partial [Dehalococcoidia bacterium]|nr:hypothetical protein [Dehalococcoidia bacterium]